MKTIFIEEDINVLCITAKSFPKDILEAHQTLPKVISFSKYFGMSRPEKGVIKYMVAVEKLEKDEAENIECESSLLKKDTIDT